jgi:hypothetical protein
MRQARGVILGGLLLAAAAGAVHAQALNATLKSSRWPGLTLKYQAAQFQLIRPEDNPGKDQEVASVSDRDELRARDGSLDVTVGANYNGFDDAAADAYLERLIGWQHDDHPDAKVTYRAHGADWAVASGTVPRSEPGAGTPSAGAPLSIFYYRVVTRCEKGKARCAEPETFATVDFTYDADEHARYDALVAAMSKTLTAARPPN